MAGKKIIDGQKPERSEHYHAFRKIEDDHFGQCIWSEVLTGRRIQVELMHYPKANSTALVVKHFDKALPRAGSMKPWPNQTATYVYLPVDDSNTWDGLDRSLTEFERRRQEAK